MRVKMKADISGSRNGRPWPRRGESVDLPDQEAAQLCAGGMAEPVAAKAKPETAVPPPAEVTEPEPVEETTAPEPETRKPRKGGRPKLPRDENGRIVRD